MRWQVKCLIDNAKALVPFHAQLRQLKGRLRPFQPDVADDLRTIEQGIRQVQWVDGERPVKGATVLEIGSGWQPLIPTLYALAGATRVFLTDLRVLLRPDTFHAALRALRLRRQVILDGINVDPQVLDYWLREDTSISVERRLEELHLVYLAPCDCRRTTLPSGSLDVITSRACLEHIPPEVLHDIFRESGRLLRRGGLACHWIDPSDHWEHQDKRLSRVNFLKYSDALFRLTSINGLNYQNRLRHPEYVDMLRQTGFRLVRQDRQVDEASLRSLSSMRVAKRFRRFSAEDLATVDSLLLAVKE
jgi:SAM-dependent methyltransferase